MALGARIKLQREALGLQQADLCKLVDGLSQQALSNLETRDSTTSEFAIRIADALGVSVRWLLDGAGRKEDRDWPFPRVARSRWDECDDTDRGYIQSAMNNALDNCEAQRRPPEPPEPGKTAPGSFEGLVITHPTTSHPKVAKKRIRGGGS